jgi:hypothetical protein
MVTEHNKDQAFLQFFNDILGTPASWSYTVDLQVSVLPQLNLASLDDRFTEEEIWSVISSLPPNKAPGPDKFTGRFLQTAWPIMQLDVMAVFDALWHLDTRNLHCVNDALMVLLPKTVEAAAMKDYRPISLIHVISKLISKVLSNRLAPWLGELVQTNQSAFIKGSVIQDNFKMVQLTTKLLHMQK